VVEPTEQARLPTDASASTLKEHNISPPSVVKSDPLSDAHNAEAGSLVKGEAGGVLRKDPGLECPDSGSFRRVDDGMKERCPDAPAPRLLSNKDGQLGDAGINQSAGD